MVTRGRLAVLAILLTAVVVGFWVGTQVPQHPGVPVAAPVPAATAPQATAVEAPPATDASSSVTSSTGGPAGARPLTSARGTARPTAASTGSRRTHVSTRWVAAMAPKVGLSEPALRAYANAEVVVRSEMPACHVGWSTLAGIGHMESGHGTIGGRSLGADGTVSSPILGPVLDGKEFAAIEDTDGGHLDGDTRWDRAVGPMQFIPSSWQASAQDGNGDGRADPQNLDDAALTAAAYLCASGADLTTPEGWARTIFSYNHSTEYIRGVLDAANEYGRRSLATSTG